MQLIIHFYILDFKGDWFMFSKFKRHSFLILMSLIVLILSAGSLFLPSRKFSELENRFLQTMPKFTIKSFFKGTYTSQFESAINDQFPLRDKWISLKSKCILLLGMRENNGIIYGNSNHLFKRFDTLNQDTFAKNTQAVITFINNHSDTPIYFMLIPDGYALLQKLLPPYILKVDQLKWIKEVYYILNNTCTVRTINITPHLLRHHSDDYIYYRTDHHWTSQGAYIAVYNFILATGNLPTALPNPLRHSCDSDHHLFGPYTDFYEVDNFYGTYYNSSKFTDIPPDTIEYFEPNVSVAIDGTPYPGLYDRAKFNTSDKYAAFLWGNNSLTTVINNDLPEDAGRLLLIKDSFGNSAVPFLSCTYKQIDVIDLRYITFNLSEYLKANHFDEILIMYNFTSFNNDRNISKLNY